MTIVTIEWTVFTHVRRGSTSPREVSALLSVDTFTCTEFVQPSPMFLRLPLYQQTPPQTGGIDNRKSKNAPCLSPPAPMLSISLNPSCHLSSPEVDPCSRNALVFFNLTRFPGWPNNRFTLALKKRETATVQMKDSIQLPKRRSSDSNTRVFGGVWHARSQSNEERQFTSKAPIRHISSRDLPETWPGESGNRQSLQGLAETRRQQAPNTGRSEERLDPNCPCQTVDTQSTTASSPGPRFCA